MIIDVVIYSICGLFFFLAFARPAMRSMPLLVGVAILSGPLIWLAAAGYILFCAYHRRRMSRDRRQQEVEEILEPAAGADGKESE